MRLPRTPWDELWLKATALVAIEAMEVGDYELVQFALIWMDECAEVVW